MKFKAIFLLFNGALILSFLLIFFMPFFLLGADFFSIFWTRNWVISVVFLLTLAGINVYFGLNWGLFGLLEKEDWPGLVSYLENRIFNRKMSFPMYVRMLLNAYLVTSNTEGILALETFLKARKPGMIARFGMQFGIPYLLMKDPSRSEAFFSALLANKRVADRDWVRWNRAFCLLQQGKTAEAKEELLALFDSERDPILRMLCLYLLDVSSGQDPETDRRVEQGRRELARDNPAARMNRRIEKAAENMEIVVISKIVADASKWLYGGPDGGRAGTAEQAPTDAAVIGPEDRPSGSQTVH
jgi:hypothetical protein